MNKSTVLPPMLIVAVALLFGCGGGGENAGNSNTNLTVPLRVAMKNLVDKGYGSAVTVTGWIRRSPHDPIPISIDMGSGLMVAKPAIPAFQSAELNTFISVLSQEQICLGACSYFYPSHNVVNFKSSDYIPFGWIASYPYPDSVKAGDSGLVGGDTNNKFTVASDGFNSLLITFKSLNFAEVRSKVYRIDTTGNIYPISETSDYYGGNTEILEHKVMQFQPGKDTVAPTNLPPQVTNFTITQATLTVTSDEYGTGYYLVKPASSPAPSVAEVMTGITTDLVANTPATTTLVGLTYNTSYDIYFVAKDWMDNVQPTAQRVSLTTVNPNVVVQGGLTWMPITFHDDWPNANAYCANSGRRMPTILELTNLYASGAMNGQGWDLSTAWSSTPAFRTGEHQYAFLTYNAFSQTRSANDTLFAFGVTCVQ